MYGQGCNFEKYAYRDEMGSLISQGGSADRTEGIYTQFS